MNQTVHTPVMLKEVVGYLNPAPGKVYIDATVGAAGHTKALAAKGARVLGIDHDEQMLEIAREELKKAGVENLVTLKKGNFSQLASIVSGTDFTEVEGILFDLGISSYHLDEGERGFSFRYEAPLDMRMDKDLTVTAKDLVNALGRKELYDLFTKLGEEHAARRIAEAIVEKRRVKPIETTAELAQIIEKVSPRSRIHPATRVFQALRIAVNDELNELEAALPVATSLLKDGGVLAVISFHSLEDRIVKNYFKETVTAGIATHVTSKPQTPTEEEVNSNPRSRSAKLRIIKIVKGGLS